MGTIRVEHGYVIPVKATLRSSMTVPSSSWEIASRPSARRASCAH